MTKVTVTPEGTTIESDSEIIVAKEFSFAIQQVGEDNPVIESLNNSTGAAFTFTRIGEGKIKATYTIPGLANMKFLCLRDKSIFYTPESNTPCSLVVSSDGDGVYMEVRNSANQLVDDVLRWLHISLLFFPQPAFVASN